MRNFALAVVGLAALGHALPTAEASAKTVEERQVFGEPTSVFIPGGGSAPERKPKKGILRFPSAVKAPDFAVGRRGLAHVDDLQAAFETLAAKYAQRPPSLNMYLILQHLAALLAAEGRPTDVFYLGPVETGFRIGSSSSAREKRQDGVFGIGGGCNVDDLIGLLLTYSSLESIYGSDPPKQIKTLKEAIHAALVYCHIDPEAGAIIPDPTKPGAPVRPDPASPGAPIRPDRASEAAPMVPEPRVEGAPMVPEPRVAGTPMVPEPRVTGAPMAPEPKIEGAPMIPGL